uniref:CCHC-type domain-containing protein n=1 Tax=Acrobeloides nanus TaxID=290746 RepID=A0A914EQM9_9BILA
MNILLLLSFTTISLAKIVVEISPIEVVDTGQNDEEILITEITVQNAPEIFRDGTKFYNLLFASRNDTGFDQLIEEFHSAAVDFQNEQVRFCYINTDLEANNLLLNLFELKKEDLPAIRLFEIYNKIVKDLKEIVNMVRNFEDSLENEKRKKETLANEVNRGLAKAAKKIDEARVEKENWDDLLKNVLAEKVNKIQREIEIAIEENLEAVRNRFENFERIPTTELRVELKENEVEDEILEEEINMVEQSACKPFDGLGLPWSLWLRRFNDLAESQTVPWDDGVKLRKLPMYLEGTPRERWEDIEAVDRNTFDKATEKMKQLFENPLMNELAMQKLTTLRQRENENVLMFSRRLEELVRSAMIGESKNEVQKKLKFEFLDRLRPDLQFEVKKDRPKTYEEALSRAQYIEGLLIASQVSRTAKMLSSVTLNTTEEEANAIMNGVWRGLSKTNESYGTQNGGENYNSFGNKQNYGYQKFGNCSKNDFGKNGNENNLTQGCFGSGGNYYCEAQRCSICNKLGHWAEECWNNEAYAFDEAPGMANERDMMSELKRLQMQLQESENLKLKAQIKCQEKEIECKEKETMIVALKAQNEKFGLAIGYPIE